MEKEKYSVEELKDMLKQRGFNDASVSMIQPEVRSVAQYPALPSMTDGDEE